MDILGVEIFQTGRWNNVKTFDEADLDAMVESFQALASAGRVPLKLGHNPEQPMTDGQPALGWVSRVWREGERLLADFTAMPRAVYDAVKAALYKFVSIEMYRDVAHNGREYPWVLGAVALLGADIPAVRGLKDLQALAMSRGTALRLGAALTFTRDVSTSGGRKTMADEKKDLEALTARLDALSGKVETFAAENATLKAENKRLTDEAEAREKAIKADKVQAHRGAIKQKFDEAINDKLILASTRDMFERDPAFKSDDGVLGISLTFVDQYIKERYVFGAKKPTRKAGGDAGTDSLGDDGPESEAALKDADGTLLRLCEHERATNLQFSQQPYGVVQLHMLRKYPKLAEAYRSQPGVKGGA